MKSKILNNLKDLLYILFNQYMILVIYFVFFRRTLGNKYIEILLDKIDWTIVVMIFILFPILTSILAYLNNLSKKRSQLKERPLLLKILIIILLTITITFLPKIEYMHANLDYICQVCLRPKDETTIKPDDPNRNSKFRWLGFSLFTFTISDFSIRKSNQRDEEEIV